MRHMVVVGAGITGLAAAWQASHAPGWSVTVVDSDPRAGGKIHTSAITLDDGTEMVIDEGADAFLARVPDAVELCEELGLAEELTSPAVGRAKVFLDGELRFLPELTVLGVPTDMDALAAADVLSPEGLAQVAAEWQHRGPAPDGDVAIGPFLTERFGEELVDRVVGPLVGGINAGDVRELSLDAVTPQLADAAADGDSLAAALAARHQAAPPSGPVFHTLPGGTGRLVDALVDALASRGVVLRLASPVEKISRAGDGWALRVDGDAVQADGVVLTTPAPVTASLLETVCPDAGRELSTMTHSSVALVTLVYRREDVPVDLDASGLLVPPSQGLFMTAVSWGSTKWAHWDDGRHVVLRVSAGRTGDDRQAGMDEDELVAALRADLSTTMGIDADPVAVRACRWALGFTQYRVGHLDLVARIESALERDCPGLTVAGAAYRGLGLPACIRQGREAVAGLISS